MLTLRNGDQPGEEAEEGRRDESSVFSRDLLCSVECGQRVRRPPQYLVCCRAGGESGGLGTEERKEGEGSLEGKIYVIHGRRGCQGKKQRRG